MDCIKLKFGSIMTIKTSFSQHCAMHSPHLMLCKAMKKLCYLSLSPIADGMQLVENTVKQDLSAKQ